MPKNAINLPTPLACAQGAVLCATSARGDLRLASRSTRSGDHGLALFLTVAALEEAVKSLALAAAFASQRDGALHPKVGDPLSKLLRDHGSRYAVASFGGALAAPLLEKRPGGLSWATVGALLVIAVAFSAMDPQQREDAVGSAIAEVLKAGRDGLAGWYAIAGTERSAGLYVDWDGHRWTSPTDVDTARVMVARRQVVPIVRLAERTARELGSIDPG